MRRTAAPSFRSPRLPAFICLVLACSACLAAEPALEGLWQTIDDHGGKPRAIVRIIELAGEYRARVEKIFPQAGEDANPRCENCTGARHNQPVEGMLIVEGMRRDGKEYGGGEILDPETGEIYRCRMRLAEDGRQLMVRGYVGISLFGRSQTWLRAEP